jgi:hypothetical protein
MFQHVNRVKGGETHISLVLATLVQKGLLTPVYKLPFVRCAASGKMGSELPFAVQHMGVYFRDNYRADNRSKNRGLRRTLKTTLQLPPNTQFEMEILVERFRLCRDGRQSLVTLIAYWHGIFGAPWHQ